MNKLQCPLCREMFNEPCMCPHCSQVYCRRCIKKYLEDFYFCPSCDRHVIDVVDCSRLINQVKEKIKESDLKKAKQNPLIPLQQCSQHSLPLKYYCMTCETEICSDCGLISQKHKSHIIQPIQKIKPPKNIITQSQLRQIKQKISQKLMGSQEQQKRHILELQLLKSQIKYNKTRIYEYYEELIIRMQKQTKVLLKEIEERIQQCTKQISQKQSIRKKIDEMEKKHIRSMMEQCYSPLVEHLNAKSTDTLSNVEISDKQLYKYLTEKNYIRPIQQLQEKQLKHRKMSLRRKDISKKLLKREEGTSSRIGGVRNYHDKLQVVGVRHQSEITQHEEYSQCFSNNSLLFDKKIYELGIMKEIYPEYHNFSFQMDYLISKDEDVVYSPHFKVYGYEWRLKIYPKGNAQAHNSHLSLFLQLINSPQALSTNTAKQYFFRLQLLNLNHAGKSIIKQYNSRFSVGECWGYADFIQVQQLKEYLHDGKLLFVMGVKNVSYYDQCDNMKRYIVKLEGETRVLSELCENYYLANNLNNSGEGQEHHHSVVGNAYNSSIVGNQLGLDSSSSSLSGQVISGSMVSEMGVQSHHLAIEDEISSIISSFDGENILQS